MQNDNFCQLFGGTLSPTSKKAADRSPLLVACTLPRRHWPKWLLVQRQKSLASGDATDRCARRLDAYNGVFERAEAADPSLVDGNRDSGRNIRNARSAGNIRCGEPIAALGAAAQNTVDEASRSRGRRARSRTAKIRQSGRETDCR